jgi:type IV pilus assembly protein PilN
MLKINVNLSPDPFINNRKFYLISGLLLLLLTSGSYWNVTQYLQVHSRRAGTENLLVQDRDHLERLDQQEKEIKTRLLRPETADFLETVEYINRLIEKKTFSWTRLLNDLERLTPANIQIVSIRPSVSRNEFGIEITANARNSADYVEFVSNLENSEKFQNVTPVYEDISKTPGFVGKQIALTARYKR